MDDCLDEIQHRNKKLKPVGASSSSGKSKSSSGGFNSSLADKVKERRQRVNNGSEEGSEEGSGDDSEEWNEDECE
jgi:hypothetical protein